MHFEILVEDLSGKTALDILIPKIIGDDHTFKVISYRGVGRVPTNLNPKADPTKRILLDRLPKLIRGYGKTFSSYPPDYPAVLIVVCDLDDRCLSTFRQTLLECVHQCDPRPKTYFCIAVEEGEAWFLGDLEAIKSAYLKAKKSVLNSYTNDSICKTWEKLADAIFLGGYKSLSKNGWQAVGQEKMTWALKISPLMDVEKNQSPSFCYFRDKLRSLI